MRWLAIGLLGLGVWASHASAQDRGRDDGAAETAARDAARARTLARWTEAEGRLADPRPPDPRRILCAGRAPSCMCPGFPGEPPPVWANQDEVVERIMRCVERSLHGLGPVGRVEIELTVTPDGRVRAGRVVTNETGDEGVASCVLRAVMTARFSPRAPGMGGERVLRYPVIFAPPVTGEVTASGSSASR